MKRRRRDSNPRYLSVQRFSRPSHDDDKVFNNQGLTADAEDCLQTSLQTKPQNASVLPPELAKIIDRWDSLPEHIKATINTLVDSVGK